MNMERLRRICKKALIAAGSAALMLRAIHAQTPKFEVISVKPNPVLSGAQFTEFKTKPAPQPIDELVIDHIEKPTAN
jgi:hypothetical protein